MAARLGVSLLALNSWIAARVLAVDAFGRRRKSCINILIKALSRLRFSLT